MAAKRRRKSNRVCCVMPTPCKGKNRGCKITIGPQTMFGGRRFTRASSLRFAKCLRQGLRVEGRKLKVRVRCA